MSWIKESLRRTFIGRKIEETITHRSQEENRKLEKNKMRVTDDES